MPALQVSALQGCPQYSTQSPVDITRNVTLTCNFLFTATHNFNSRGGEGSKNKRWDLDYAKLTWKMFNCINDSNKQWIITQGDTLWVSSVTMNPFCRLPVNVKKKNRWVLLLNASLTKKGSFEGHLNVFPW